MFYVAEIAQSPDGDKSHRLFFFLPVRIGDQQAVELLMVVGLFALSCIVAPFRFGESTVQQCFHEGIVGMGGMYAL